MEFFTADLHFDDENIIKYYHRPFKDVDEMNQRLIDNIVEKFKTCKTDYYPTQANPIKFFILGDFGNEDYLYKILDRLIDEELWIEMIVVKGNHDKNYLLGNDRYVGVEFSRYPIMYNGLWLSHEPITYMPSECPYLNIHGHTHNLRYGNGGSWADGNRYYNVSVENTHYYPISLDRIKKEMFI